MFDRVFLSAIVSLIGGAALVGCGATTDSNADDARGGSFFAKALSRGKQQAR